MDVMMKRTIWIGLTLSLLGLAAVPSARADEYDKKTVLTFSQPVEIPGRVLPAGTYTFKLADSMTDRHIVQIFNADGSEIIATVMTIPDYRLKSSDNTLIRFTEVPAGSPEAIRAWFYPGNTVGEEFVYSRSRATVLARSAKAPVPAISGEATDVTYMRSAQIVAITPDQQEVPVTVAIQTTPVDDTRVTSGSSSVTGTTGTEESRRFERRHNRHLPRTASTLPMIALLGFGLTGAGFGLMIYRRRETSSAL